MLKVLLKEVQNFKSTPSNALTNVLCEILG